MFTLRSLLLSGCLAVASIGAAGAQIAPDTVACRAILGGATRDSQTVRVVLHVRPFDSARVRMSAAYRELIGDGVKSRLEVPRPLGLTTYDNAIEGPDGKTNDQLATLTLQTAFGATLHRDGHLSNVRSLGGTSNAAFEHAMVRAIRAVSDSSLLTPAVAPDVVFKGDSFAIRLVVQPDLTSPASKSLVRPPARGDTPLMLLRLPAHHATQTVSPQVARRPPEYPTSMRRARIEGKTVLTLVIDETGKPDLSTVDVVETPAFDFVRAILEVLPTFRFRPLVVDNCPVPVVVSMPFEFHLTP
jgi:TonB family protein